MNRRNAHAHLIGERDEDAFAGAPELPVEDGVEDGVVVLDVLHEQRVAEAQRRLEVLAERVVEEARLGDLAVGVLLQDELGRLPRRVDDQRVPGPSYDKINNTNYPKK